MTNLKAYFIASHRSQWTLLARSKNLPLPSVVPVRQPSHQCYDPFPNLLFYFNAPETQSVSRAHSDSWPNAVAMRIWRWSNRRSENMLGQINLLLLSFACYVADCKFYFAFVAFLIKKRGTLWAYQSAQFGSSSNLPTAWLILVPSVLRAEDSPQMLHSHYDTHQMHKSIKCMADYYLYSKFRYYIAHHHHRVMFAVFFDTFGTYIYWQWVKQITEIYNTD